MLSIRDRLISQIDGFSTASCFVSDYPEPPATLVPPSDVWATVAPNDGTFPEQFFAGAGIETLNEQTEAIVTVFSIVALDNPGHTERGMLDESTGLVARWKPAILRALLVNWEPTYDGDELLRDQMQPTRSTGPHQWMYGSRQYLRLSLVFSISFDWDLGEVPA